MRRLSDVTIQLDDRLTPARPQRQKRPARGKSAPEIAAPRGDRATSRQQIRRRGVSPFLMRRIRRIGLAAFVLGACAAFPFWLTHSAAGLHLQETARAQVLDLTARAGFRVSEISVEGRHRTPAAELLQALQVGRGDPILGVDLTATRERLELISWVKTATLERRLPGELRLLITERDPIAIWQNQGHYYLVDKDGLVVGDQVEEFPELSLIVGEGAPDHAADLLEMLKSEPDLASRVKAAQWISGRRWNLTFDDTQTGIDVRLPEEGAADAYHDLARLEREQKLLERKVTLIDMRLPDRLVLRATGKAEESAAAAHGGAANKRNAKPGKDA